MRRVLRLAQPFQHRMTDNQFESPPELETLDLRVWAWPVEGSTDNVGPEVCSKTIHREKVM